MGNQKSGQSRRVEFQFSDREEETSEASFVQDNATPVKQCFQKCP